MKIVVLKCDISYTLIAHVQSDKQLAKLNPRTQNPIEKEEIYNTDHNCYVIVEDIVIICLIQLLSVDLSNSLTQCAFSMTI